MCLLSNYSCMPVECIMFPKLFTGIGGENRLMIGMWISDREQRETESASDEEQHCHQGRQTLDSNCKCVCVSVCVCVHACVHACVWAYIYIIISVLVECLISR